MKNLVSTDWLEQNLKTVRVLDGSWHMPNTNRNAFEEFNNKHIDNALFFDLDKNSDQKSSLPHMLPNKSTWEKIISEFGIKNSDHIIIYDNSDVISSCRIWYNFLYFGHNPNLVSVLDGGLKKWLMDNKKISNLVAKFPISSYLAKENSSMVLEKNQIDLNIQNKKFELIDARSKERFLGLQPEPRKELRSGNIKGSKNIPFVDLINKDDSTFKNKKQIKSIFNQLNLDPTNCGSGVTACVLGLANSIVSGRNPLIYDGSWSEYGLIKNEKI